MPGIFGPGAVAPGLAFHSPGVMNLVSRSRCHGMIAAWYEDRIAVLDNDGFVERVGIFGARIHSHESETLWRVHLKVVDFFHWDLRVPAKGVVLVRRG